MILNPGSREAIKEGCTCPVMDNGYGSGSGYRSDDGEMLYYISDDCILHVKANKSIN